MDFKQYFQSVFSHLLRRWINSHLGKTSSIWRWWWKGAFASKSNGTVYRNEVTDFCLPAVKWTDILNVWHTKLSENRVIQDTEYLHLFATSNLNLVWTTHRDHQYCQLSWVMIWVWLQKGNQVKNGFKKSILSSYVEIFHNKCVSRLLKQIWSSVFFCHQDFLFYPIIYAFISILLDSGVLYSFQLLVK